MTKLAFMFPGQGSLEEGMGREIAEAVPAAMLVYDEGSEAAGLDLKKLCFDTPLAEMVDTEVQQPALVATSLAISEAIRARGIVPDFVVGHSVGEFAALGDARALSPRDAIALVRERGLAMAAAARERPGAMAAILGLADEAVEGLCHKIENVWPANYNCFHSPLVGRAADRLRPAIEKVHFEVPRSPFMSTVTAKLEEAQRYRELLVEQLTAPVKFTQAARRLIDQGVTVFVEVGPGNVLSGLLKRIDKRVKAISVNDLKSLDELESVVG
jgi:[acyl-carrier-protein] S-malonyltransferase